MCSSEGDFDPGIQFERGEVGQHRWFDYNEGKGLINMYNVFKNGTCMLKVSAFVALVN